ncbi:hypothetical protein [Pedobacter sp. CFBP9032]|uniref:hypothetical protein n=1 Tax=Pedobacter sp. CFBP9032 TaxID=3096539 RepID=UPI002A69C89F|nr:hypothetical protein [Pedobacter sp. CFBP9032]MDY0907196.1 hypothetical protein [Pedobacter sp. CFBP9032]
MNLKESKKPKLKLLKTDEHEFSRDCIDEFYTCIAGIEGERAVITKVGNLRIKVFFIGLFRRVVSFIQPKISISFSKDINFSAQMGPDLKMCLPYFLYSTKNFIYMFDGWPRFHHELGKLFDLLSVKAIFFSSRDVVAKFRANVHSKCKAYWIPEGINAIEYTFEDYQNKDIDVLEFGRAYKPYHDQIFESLAVRCKKHLFSTTDQPILFKTKLAFKVALAQTKISICIPSNITHPARAEDISTMTLRYLQCMASKCLILGIMPDEMNELFDYKPIIEIDMQNPGEQLLTILDNYANYHDLIERNYLVVREKHQWQNRWQQIEYIISTSI